MTIEKIAEVDIIVDDYDSLSIVPIEIKSGRDYKIHSALNNLLTNKKDVVKKSYVFSNNREINIKNNIIYMPIYFISFT